MEGVTCEEHLEVSEEVGRVVVIGEVSFVEGKALEELCDVQELLFTDFDTLLDIGFRRGVNRKLECASVQVCRIPSRNQESSFYHSFKCLHSCTPAQRISKM